MLQELVLLPFQKKKVDDSLQRVEEGKARKWEEVSSSSSSSSSEDEEEKTSDSESDEGYADENGGDIKIKKKKIPKKASSKVTVTAARKRKITAPASRKGPAPKAKKDTQGKKKEVKKPAKKVVEKGELYKFDFCNLIFLFRFFSILYFRS